MNVFNLISAGGGSGSGLYIWKKSAYTPAQNVVNPSFTLTYTSTTKATISNANFDYMALPQIFGNSYIVNNDTEDMKTVCTFYDGFKSTLSATYKFVVNTVNRLELFYQGASTYLYGINDGVVTTASSMNYWTTLDFVYNGTKTLPAKIGDFIDYVISDKEDAYPDGAVHDGYYYERYKEIPLESINALKFETGTITSASGYPTSLTVNHSLGEAPTKAFLIAETMPARGEDWLRGTMISPAGITSSNSFIYKSGCGIGNTGRGASNSTTVTFNTDTTYTFGAGVTYRYILFAGNYYPM